MSESVVVKYTMPREKGKVTRQFTVWCGVCGDWEMQSANHLDQFLDSISAKNGNWRLTAQYGWTHKKCMRMLPTTIKFNINERDPAQDPQPNP